MQPNEKTTEFTEILLEDPAKPRYFCTQHCITHWLTNIKAFLGCLIC